jgi:transposase-like protein
MTRPYSVAFKQKMVERLTGKNAISANSLAEETGVRQQNLSRWLREARNLPQVEADKPSGRKWTVEQKARLLADASRLNGDELMVRLEREGLTFAEFEQWRLALEEGGMASVATSRQIRKLERELARKEKALAEAAALLVLKKTVESAFHDEDDDTDEKSER